MTVPEWLKDEYVSKYPDWAHAKKDHAGRDRIDGHIMPDLKVLGISTGETRFYHFSFGELDGWRSWAIFSINDTTGEFNIQSDWGNYQHRWNIEHLGETHLKHEMPLTHFLAVRHDAAYVTDKLHYGRDDRVNFDGVATEQHLKKMLLEKRRNRDIERDAARECWNDIEDLDYSSAEAVYYSLNDSLHRVTEFLSIDHEDMMYEPSFGYTFLQYKLLPFFFEYLRREVLSMES